MAIGATYSFKSLTGVLTNPNVGATILLSGGNIGAGQFTVSMETVRTVQDVAADGTILISYVAGDNGRLAIEVQESSILHQELLSLYNTLLTAANKFDVSAWAATVISFRMLTDGSQHILTGVSFEKFPDKPYQAHGQRMTWNLMVANAINM
jgi:Protein of unknown function (DUF3277)